MNNLITEKDNNIVSLPNVELEIAADLGNSKLKMIFDRDEKSILREPSVMRRIIKQPEITETNEKKLMANIFDQLFANVSSPSIKRAGSFMVGKRALTSTGGTLQNMNINLGKKYKEDLPIINLLTYIAAKATKDHYDANSVIPSALHVHCDLSTAIPASEYSVEKAGILEGRFKKGVHTVVLYIGDKQVTVQISFKFVKVTREGVPSLYAILEGPNEYFEEFNEIYQKENGKKIDGNFFAKKKILHADIGDGTSEYIYTEGMKPISDACTGARRGVGHALEEASELLKDQFNGNVELNRQQLAETLRNKTDKYYIEARNCMDEAIISQATLIHEDIQERYIRYTSSQAEIFAVYGGGSVTFKDELHKELKEFADEVKAQILWIPEKHAADMNVLGLNIMNKRIFLKTKKKFKTETKEETKKLEV
ncbi:ParM/StbA family protein [Bacillus sp. IS1]|uniref:ParM/StbA family protein n=1 Tax=Bacillus TaxID=1386 RepID=UPI0028FA1D38|nr:MULTISPECIES: ParM/StbA family protein [unclassified Bacillus (in: firmicutes)]MDU0078299.1 ParM/StbA family protein [Bacillus sp. IG2]MDU0104007.1 ParM/StbA family protein [Bacillus sp. IS1]